MPLFGEKRFKKNERAKIQNECNEVEQLTPSNVRNKKEPSVKCSELIHKANSIFGFNGWSHSVTHQTIDFIEFENGKYEAGVSALVKVLLKDGTFHEDIGYGVAKGFKCKGTALSKARKLAASDALMCTLQSFGKAFESLPPSGKITDFLSPPPVSVPNNVRRQLTSQFTSDKELIPSLPSRSLNANVHEPIISQPSTSQLHNDISPSSGAFLGTPLSNGHSQDDLFSSTYISPQRDLATEKRKRKIRQLEKEIASREKFKNELLMQSELDDDFNMPRDIVVKQELMDN